jgi:hypothetical protein
MFSLLNDIELEKIEMGRILTTLFLSGLISFVCTAKEYHVSIKGSDQNTGSITQPFKTINFAAQLARPGDIIIVHSGTYREWINPARGGENDFKRIVYRSAKGETVEIKGSEIIKGWKKDKDGVWKVTLSNSFFGNYNPYKDTINGDWFVRQGRLHHTGEVFLNGKSMYERETPEKVYKPIKDSLTTDPEGAKFTWYCESNSQNTTIWANFHEFDPNKELVEITTRKTCFYPDKEGLNYITISGFHVSQAATQWAPPTAEQVGMIATHWNKGWIIENNVINDSKCAGITLGKERETGQNVWSADTRMDGGIGSIEVIFRALKKGWDKEHVGSHIVRNNTIYNCEQAGICGNMGAAFSVIENNHIYNIWRKRQFSGFEIAGIKFHAAIDALIRKNRIHDCKLGCWFDWMTQGTRLTGNILYNNNPDVFFEVDHGPYMVDNNIFLSANSIADRSQGGAYVHNLVAGGTAIKAFNTRYTPYHLPHSTEIAGVSHFFCGDDRYYNNIFIGKGNKDPRNIAGYGTAMYNKVGLPVWIEGNLYYNMAAHCDKEVKFVESPSYDPEVTLQEEGDHGYLQFTFDDAYYNFKGEIVNTKLLGKTIVSKVIFDNPDGTSLRIDKDYFGNFRSDDNNSAGPFTNLPKGKSALKIW